MKVHILPAFEDNYIFVLAFQGKALVIDPGDENVVLPFLEDQELELDTILQTHHHWDHVDGTPALKKAFPNTLVYTPYFQKGRYPVSTKMLKEGDKLSFGHWSFQVMKTAGHTFDHISFYDQQRKVLFCGDTLFNIGCGRLFDGDIENLFLSLQKIKSLPDETKVYCTHEYTMANIAFAQSLGHSNDLEVFAVRCQKLRDQNMPTIPFELGENKKLNPFLNAPDLESFARLRAQKDEFRP